MIKKDPGQKALMLISDEWMQNFVRQELEKCDFEIEEFLGMIRLCEVVILDYFYYQFGIADYLKEKGIRKTVFLVLDQNQIHTANIHPNGVLHDILVIQGQEGLWGSKLVVSALQGEGPLQTIFENDLSGKIRAA